MPPTLGLSVSFAARLAARKKSIAAGGATLLAAAGIAMAAVPAQAAPMGAQDVAKKMIPSAAQFQCFSNIVNHESGWNVHASNPSSGAYGLVQALPGSKMAAKGSDWQTNPATQIAWGLDYMNSRYGSPCGAWNFWQQNSWY
ncbi:transglycosylase SLT domain-containing protein [Streptomyces sp. NPDC023838]|uniref:aggregation-promoting factor C-terminal-like domain-containing protein n=1 Tax=Streptomyces sp. NPDC023838 TaxID=3154325 RepID=UPI00340D83A5